MGLQCMAPFLTITLHVIDFYYFVQKKASFLQLEIRKIDTFIHSFHTKKGTPSHFERVRREKFFALLSDDLGQLLDIIHFFYKFFCWCLLFVCPNIHFELKFFLQEQFFKHYCFHDSRYFFNVPIQ